MASCLPIRSAAAALLVSRALAVQTCFDILAANVLPAINNGDIQVGFTSLARRQTDGRIFSITLNPDENFVPGEPLDTQGFVCCHSGVPPQLSAGDPASPVFAAMYLVMANCTGLDGEQLQFMIANIQDPAIAVEALRTRQDAVRRDQQRVGPLVCGDRDSGDCNAEFFNAQQNGQNLGVCSRCALEGGAQPLRSRCQKCCEECEPFSCVDLPSEVPAPRTSDGLPLSVPFPQALSMPVTLFSVLVVAPSGAPLMFAPTAPMPIQAGRCCFDGAEPGLGPPGPPGFPGSMNVSQSFSVLFFVAQLSCSDVTVIFLDPFVFTQVLPPNLLRR